MKLIRILSCLMLTLVMFTACNNNKNKYEDYPAKLTGVWCDINGPELVNTMEPDTDYYYIIEFTDDNVFATHESCAKYPGYVLRAPFELNGDLIILGEDKQGRVRIAFDENDNLLLTDGRGTHTFRHPTVEELGDAGVYPIDKELFDQVADYLSAKMGTDTEQKSE